jgi:succinate dehydrogenase flavin-adding protein (antitoxin of CptAB toxin-antitoxin module)
MTIKHQLNIKYEDWYGTRELDFIPKHFTVLPYPIRKGSDILSWILNNTSGRYAFGTKLVTENNKLVSKEVLAFEDPAEATFFALSNEQPKFSDYF